MRKLCHWGSRISTPCVHPSLERVMGSRRWPDAVVQRSDARLLMQSVIGHTDVDALGRAT